MIGLTEIKKTLQAVAAEYPAPLISAQLKDINRIAFHIFTVIERAGEKAPLCDVGGGIGPLLT